jgi:hypothetical protein
VPEHHREGGWRGHVEMSVGRASVRGDSACLLAAERTQAVAQPAEVTTRFPGSLCGPSASSVPTGSLVSLM